MMLRWRGFWRDRGVRMSIMMLWVVRRMEGIWICIRRCREFCFFFVFISMLIPV